MVTINKTGKYKIFANFEWKYSAILINLLQDIYKKQIMVCAGFI